MDLAFEMSLLRERLQDRRIDLAKNMVLSETFFAVLESEGVVTAEKVEDWQSLQTPSEQKAKVLDYVERGSPDRYRSFLRALIASDQDYVVSKILKEDPTAPDLESAIKYIEEPLHSVSCVCSPGFIAEILRRPCFSGLYQDKGSIDSQCADDLQEIKSCLYHIRNGPAHREELLLMSIVESSAGNFALKVLYNGSQPESPYQIIPKSSSTPATEVTWVFGANVLPKVNGLLQLQNALEENNTQRTQTQNTLQSQDISISSQRRQVPEFFKTLFESREVPIKIKIRDDDCPTKPSLTPMTEWLDFRERLIKCLPDLIKHIKITPKFHAYLGMESVIRLQAERQDFQNKEHTKQITWLVHHVRRGHIRRYEGFIRVLLKTGQSRIVSEILQEKPHQFPISAPAPNTTFMDQPRKLVLSEKVSMTEFADYFIIKRKRLDCVRHVKVPSSVVYWALQNADEILEKDLFHSKEELFGTDIWKWKIVKKLFCGVIYIGFHKVIAGQKLLMECINLDESEFECLVQKRKPARIGDLSSQEMEVDPTT